MSRKIGVSLKIDVTKIDKTKLFKGQKGTYLDITAFIDLDEEGQYGDNGMVVQSVSKEERDAGQKGAILGNVKVFYKDGLDDAPNVKVEDSDSFDGDKDEFEEDLPF